MSWKLCNSKIKNINLITIGKCQIMKKVNWKANNKDSWEKVLWDPLIRVNIINWLTAERKMRVKRIWLIIKITKEIFSRWLMSFRGLIISISLSTSPIIFIIKINPDSSNLDFQSRSFKPINPRLSAISPIQTEYLHSQERQKTIFVILKLNQNKKLLKNKFSRKLWSIAKIINEKYL